MGALGREQVGQTERTQSGARLSALRQARVDHAVDQRARIKNNGITRGFCGFIGTTRGYAIGARVSRRRYACWPDSVIDLPSCARSTRRSCARRAKRSCASTVSNRASSACRARRPIVRTRRARGQRVSCHAKGPAAESWPTSCSSRSPMRPSPRLPKAPPSRASSTSPMLSRMRGAARR